jgi:hypothetical protein
MKHGFLRRPKGMVKGMVKAAVNFDGGAVMLDVEFWRTDESIVREAIGQLGPLADGVKNPVVERGTHY